MIFSISFSDFPSCAWTWFGFSDIEGVGDSDFRKSDGNSPLPFKSQYKFTSGNVLITFSTNSKLGLFLPESKCEILERCTPILSAKAAADNP